MIIALYLDKIMRLSLSCMQCVQELGKPTEEVYVVEFRDDGRYELRCSFGHETSILLQQQKFEILFEIGANAILDGYYREAVSSFTSSMERFYEFSIRVFIEIKMKSDEFFKELWSDVSKQSERQLGAFVFLWGSTFRESPALLPNKWIKFRNEVIHKGKIPSRDEAIEYGEIVLSLIRPKLADLKMCYSDEVRKVTFYHLRDSRKSEDSDRRVSSLGISTIISLSIGDKAHHEKSLRGYLTELEMDRKLIDSERRV